MQTSHSEPRSMVTGRPTEVARHSQAYAIGALCWGIQYQYDGNGDLQRLSDRHGQVGTWKIDVCLIPDKEGSNGLAIATREVFVTKEDPAWVEFLRKYLHFEAKARLTYGPQIAATVTSAGAVPGPYIQGLNGFRLNLGSNVISEGTADNKNGARTTATFGQKFTQGGSVTVGPISAQYDREVTAIGATNTGSFVFFGLIGVEHNFTTEETFIGLMPQAAFTMGIGIEGQIKSGFKF